METHKYKISKNKLVVILLNIFLIILQYIIIEYAQIVSNTSIDNAIILVSWLAITSFVFELLLWKKLTNELFSPFVLFSIVLYVFCLGQTIGWVLGLDLGGKDLWNRIDHGMNHQLIFDGIRYSVLSISLFFLGSIFGENTSSDYKTNYKENTNLTIKSFDLVGKVFLSISIPAVILQMYYNFSTSTVFGYAGMFVKKEGITLFRTIINILADFYQPSLLLLLISSIEKNKDGKAIVILMLIGVVAELFVGGRSGAVMTIIGILLSYHYFVKPINKKGIIYGSIGGYIGIAILNCVALIRNIPNKNLYNFINTLIDSFSNALGHFIGELGWSLSSICWTMNLVPSQYGFRYGKSYLTSFISWVPSTVFGGKSYHPTVIYSNLGDWLQNSLNMSYGPGYTMVAESYINFGWFGIIAMFFMGVIIAKFIARVKRDNSKNDILGSVFQIIFVMTIMKSLIRSSFSVAFRSFFFNIMPLFLIIKYILKKNCKKTVN